MKVYTIIGGVNGVGKSSFSGVLRQQRLDLGKIIDPDHIAAKEHCNKLEAGRIAIQEMETAIQNGWNFTQETTLSGRRTLQTILAARQKDYQIRLYYIGISSAEESLYRIANRVRKGGHNIAKQMYAADTRSDSQTSPKFCPIVTKPIFSTTKTGSQKRQFIRTAP